MNAPNSLPQDKRAAERRTYEPSMEEILASIRRIIADDQALASRRTAPAKEETPAPVAAPAPLASEADFIGDADDWVDLPVKTEVAFIAQTPGRVVAPVETADIAPDDQVAPPSESFAAAPAPAPAAEPEDFESEVLPSAFQTQVRDRLMESSGATRSGNLAEAVDFRHEVVPEVGQRRAVPATHGLPEALSGDPLVSPATDAAVSSAFSALVASRFLQSNDVLGEMVRDMIRPMLKTWLDDNLPILVERLVRAEIERVARGGR